MFCLTPNGNISACSRVTKETDSGADLFFYGHYHNKERFFEVDTNKVNQVTSHGELPKKECSTCFARWGCQGHCPIARYTDPDYTNYACHLVKSLLKYKILAQLS